ERFIGASLDAAIQNSAGKLYEIIVVDNASTDRTAEIAKRRKGVRVVREEPRGTNHARQRGVDETSGEIVAFIDADVHIPKGWVENIHAIFSTRPEVVSVSGPYHYYDGPRFQSQLIVLLWRLIPIVNRLVGYVVLGGNFAARRSAIVAMGGFNTALEFYGDDTDIARRLHTQGKVLFHSDFFVDSSYRRYATEGLCMTLFHYTINYIWTVLFHRPFTRPPQRLER
ncbi:MAG TPA: glycosyltransferase family A protein, partial [Candidatus Paceibacterota bacterium]